MLRRIQWIISKVPELWYLAGLYTRISTSIKSRNVDIPVPSHYVEFEVPGMVEPYDRLRLVGGHMSACGKARMAMSLHAYDKEWGGWNGGCIDHKDLVNIRDLINCHLELIERLSPAEKYRLQQELSERRRLKQEPMNDSVLQAPIIE
jgi:hypothetical protein